MSDEPLDVDVMGPMVRIDLNGPVWVRRDSVVRVSGWSDVRTEIELASGEKLLTNMRLERVLALLSEPERRPARQLSKEEDAMLRAHIEAHEQMENGR